VTVIKAKYKGAEALLDAYQSQFLHGGLFVPTRTEYPLGTRVVVDIRIPELRGNAMLRGYVAWRRPPRQGSALKGGVGVEFLPSERRRRDFVLAVARGEIVDIAQRRHRRLPVHLTVDWRAKDGGAERTTSQLEDIGERGAFIRTSNFLPLGSSVILELTPPGSRAPIAIQGRVAWTHHTPGEEGLGVHFRCRDAGGARRLRELVRRIEADAMFSDEDQTLEG
jgi:Tfp pilus assembly protein PilZ